MLKLVVNEKGHPEREFNITDDKERVSIGRADSNDLQISEAKASREHCMLERTPKGLKLVDLESANGTKVNGQMVNSKVLSMGDSIQIGETSFRLEEVAPAARAFKPVHQTRMIEKPRHKDSTRPSGRTHAAHPVKKRPPWELFYIAGGLLVVLILGTVAYNYFSRDSAITDELKKASATLTDAKNEGELVVRIKKYEKAFLLLQRIRDQYPETDQAATASRLKSEAQDDYKRLKTWHTRLKTIQLEVSRLQGQETISSMLALKGRIEDFIKGCPLSELTPTAQEAVVKVDQNVQSRVKRLFGEEKAEVDLVLALEEYGSALRAWQNFMDEYKAYPEVVEKAKAEAEGIEKKARSTFNLLMAKGGELIDQERFSEAAVLFRSAVKKYQGTDCAVEAGLKLRVVKLLMRGNTSLKSAQAQVEARKEVYESAAQAADHARRRDYAKAIQIYRDILAQATNREVKEEFSARVKDLELMETLFTAFRKQANNGGFSSRPWKLGAKLEVYITSADDKWVRFSLAGDKGKTQKRWTAFSDKEVVHLVELMKMTPELEYALGVYCLTNNLVDKGESVLTSAFNRDPALIDRINPLIARMRDIAVPRGGFVPYNKRWYTLKDRDTAIEDDRIAKLVATIEKGSLKKAKVAVEKLGGIPRGRGKLVAALRAKREYLKKRIAGNLQFNNATLVNLKKELDKRRNFALDFIEDAKRYPDKKVTPPDIYRKAQQEVDRRVKAVEEIWKNPYKAVVALNPAAKQINKDLSTVGDWLAKVDKSFDKKKADKVDMDYVASLANKKLSIKTFSQDTGEQKMIAFNLAVMEWNEKNQEASQLERRQVAILNKYRWMLGRRCVKIEAMLVRAARGHSAYMDSTGKWGHVIDGHPDGRTPAQRCANAGYKGAATGENISKGHTDAMGTHVAWYNSAGHHRNMINRNWLVMGAGLKGIHWTQNFGNKDTTMSDKTSPKHCGHAGSKWRGGMAKRKSK